MKLLKRRLSFGVSISSKDPQLEIDDLSKEEERAYQVKKFLDLRYEGWKDKEYIYFGVEGHRVVISFHPDVDQAKYSWLIRHVRLLTKNVIVKKQTYVEN